MVTPLGITRGSSLNINWGKCGVWLVDQWVPTSLCACVYLTIDYTLRALDIITLDACLIIVFAWDIDMLIILVDHFVFPHMLTFLVVRSLCSPWHVHSSCCLSHSSWHVWFLVVYYHDYHGACYHCQIFLSISLRVDLDDIYMFCMTVCCMTSLVPCDCMSCLSMWDTHLSPYFPVPSLGRQCFL